MSEAPLTTDPSTPGPRDLAGGSPDDPRPPELPGLSREEGAPLPTMPPGARRPRWLVPAVITSLVVVVSGAGAALYARTRADVNTVALASEPKGVTAVRALASKYQATRTYVGTLEPWVEAKIGPQLVAAYVDSVLVRPGAKVVKGDVLATLDCRSASAATRAASSMARALEARQRAHAKEAARAQELLDGGFMAANEVEQKQAQTTAEAAQLDALRAQVAGRSLEVNDCVLRAPFDGEVAARAVDPGAFVRPGTALVSLVDRGMIRLTSMVPEIDFGIVAPGKAVKIRLIAVGREVTGVIARRSPAASSVTRTVGFEVDLEDTKGEIPVGTTAEIVVSAAEPVDALEIPLTAAKIRGSKATVFVVEGGVAKSQTLRVLGEVGGSLYVASDLPEGAQIVTQGRSLLANGDKVVVKVVPFEGQGAGPQPSPAGVAPAQQTRKPGENAL